MQEPGQVVGAEWHEHTPPQADEKRLVSISLLLGRRRTRSLGKPHDAIAQDRSRGCGEPRGQREIALSRRTRQIVRNQPIEVHSEYILIQRRAPSSHPLAVAPITDVT